jgi:hypothetical protein
MALKIGVIAEEHNDIDVIYQLTCKLTPENTFTFRRRVAHGCGRLRNKCQAWSHDLIRGGCTHLVVIHDLDDKDESALRAQLEDSLGNTICSGRVILIPVFEIEAWLLSDPLALQQTFNMKKAPRIPQNPETIRHPKEYLRDIVWKNSKKRYVNTVHNKRIASILAIGKVLVCHSFTPYPLFVRTIFSTSQHSC